MATVARAATIQAPRQFSTSIQAQKTATEAVKETAEAVNRKIGQTLAGGIEGAGTNVSFLSL